MAGSFSLINMPSLQDKDSVTEEEAKMIWNAAQSAMIAMLIKLLWYTGLRISEALALTTASLQREGMDYKLLVWTEKVGKIQGQSKPDILPIRHGFALDLVDYTRQHCSSGSLLFPIHRSTAWRQIQKCAKLAGLTNWREIHPHSFRHGFIYDKASKGVHPYVLTKLARHRDLKTTLGYYRPTDRDLLDAMER
jgi:integrase/recombinase XerC